MKHLSLLLIIFCSSLGFIDTPNWSLSFLLLLTLTFNLKHCCTHSATSMVANSWILNGLVTRTGCSSLRENCKGVDLCCLKVQRINSVSILLFKHKFHGRKITPILIFLRYFHIYHKAKTIYSRKIRSIGWFVGFLYLRDTEWSTEGNHIFELFPEVLIENFGPEKTDTAASSGVQPCFMSGQLNKSQWLPGPSPLLQTLNLIITEANSSSPVHWLWLILSDLLLAAFFIFMAELTSLWDH